MGKVCLKRIVYVNIYFLVIMVIIIERHEVLKMSVSSYRYILRTYLRDTVYFIILIFLYMCR